MSWRPSPDTTNPSLLVRLRQADEGAWHSLVDLYGPLVFIWCRKTGLREADIDDVGQEVFLAVRRGLGSFRKERPGDTFRGWLRTITRNKVSDHFRKQGREPAARGGSQALEMQRQVPDSDQPQNDDLDERLPDADESNELRELVRRGLNQVRAGFDEKSIRAFLGTAVEQRSAAEVGLELGLTANAVNIAKCRVRKALQLILGELDPDRPPLA